MDLALALDKKNGHRGEFQPRRMGGMCSVVQAGTFFLLRQATTDHKGI